MGKRSTKTKGPSDAELRRAERLASLGTMASGLAHELRNPLNAAHLQLNVAQRKLARAGETDLDAAREAVALAQHELMRLADLVSDFLQFAKPRALQLAPCDLRAMAQTVIDSLHAEAGRAGVRIELESGCAVESEVDCQRLEEALRHLVRNAIDASPSGETVRVRLDLEAAMVHLLVVDAGPGVPPGAAIFEPFFTTKEGGTGLGLAIVHRIVLDHGGAVTFDSTPGHTEFRIAVPARQRP